MRQDKNAIRKMVKTMAKAFSMSADYMMCIGNRIPFNIPPEAVKL